MTVKERRKKEKPEKQPRFTLQDRLEYGNLTIDEVCELAQRSKTAFYEDVKAGLITIRKAGRRSNIFGPDAKRYIAGFAA